MSDSAGFAIPLRSSAEPIDCSPQTVDVDVHAIHSFPFGRRRWLAGAGICLQAALLIVAGVFLLTQVASTPNLAVQVAMVGSLLTLGGVALLFRSLGDFRARLNVDANGLRARLGWSGFEIPWSRVDRWSVSDRQRTASQLPGITVWAAGSKRLFTIPDDHLDDKDRREIRHLFRALAPSKEAEQEPAAHGRIRTHAKAFDVSRN